MRVLFVSSGNSKVGISPIVKNQGNSLVLSGCTITYFRIEGRGIRGYLGSIKSLKKETKIGQYDIIHAHYSLSAYVAGLAGAQPLIVSLMGSDVKGGKASRVILKILSWLFNWQTVIVKSKGLRLGSGKFDSAHVIPNGVDTEQFIPKDQKQCCAKLGWNDNDVNILFAANPLRKEKNFALAREALKRIDTAITSLHVLNDIPHNELDYWYNAADVVLLSSLWEGSPNVIKEAMACNCPIVATDVGDIRWLFGNTPGHFISGFSPDEFAGNLKLAIDYSKKHGQTQGRSRILELGLDAVTVAKRIIEVYKTVLTK
jgi:teichuronic acid biosynthesis glycosyltransferase TuaC